VDSCRGSRWVRRGGKRKPAKKEGQKTQLHRVSEAKKGCARGPSRLGMGEEVAKQDNLSFQRERKNTSEGRKGGGKCFSHSTSRRERGQASHFSPRKRSLYRFCEKRKREGKKENAMNYLLDRTAHTRGPVFSWKRGENSLKRATQSAEKTEEKPLAQLASQGKEVVGRFCRLMKGGGGNFKGGKEEGFVAQRAHPKQGRTLSAATRKGASMTGKSR